MSISIEEYTCNLLAGKKYISKIYNDLAKTFTLNNINCTCFHIEIPNVGHKTYTAQELKNLYNTSCYTSLNTLYQNGLTLDNYIMILFKGQKEIQSLYSANTTANSYKDQNRLYCYAFNNPYGQYANVTTDRLILKGYYNINKFICNCSSTFNSLLVFNFT